MSSDHDVISPAPSEAEVDEYLDVDDAQWLIRASRLLALTLRGAIKRTALRLETWLVLEAVEHRAMRLTELTDEIGGLKGSVSRWLTTLSEQGLIDYQHSGDDRRDKMVRITDYGTQQLREARERVTAAMQDLEIPLDAAERYQLRDIYQRVQQSTTRRNHGRPR